MWQRDILERTQDWGVWLGLALALHVGLLFAAATLYAPTWRTIGLVRVALLMGGANGKGEPAGGGQAAAPAHRPAPIAPPADQAAVPVKPRPVVHKIRKAADRRQLKPDDTATAKLTDPSAAPADSIAPTGTGIGTAKGGDTGSGSGSGVGGDQGDGTGAGTGSGSGGDQRGYCVYCPEPGYPMIARRRGWSGRVDVELVLLADGRVDSAGVMRSSGHEALDREALEVARRSRFRLPSPSTAPVRGHIEYRFELTQ